MRSNHERIKVLASSVNLLLNKVIITNRKSSWDYNHFLNSIKTNIQKLKKERISIMHEWKNHQLLLNY